MPIAYPYRFDAAGRTASPASKDEHLRQLIEQVLFTAPGERVNRPDFGSGVNQLVFAPASDEMATATHHLVRAALQQWLGSSIEVVAVAVDSDDATLTVTVQYAALGEQERRTVTVARAV